VICSIHQPSKEIFNVFSHTLLLAEGRVIYTGATLAMLGHFREHGQHCPDGVNPADYALRVALYGNSTMPLFQSSLTNMDKESSSGDHERKNWRPVRPVQVIHFMMMQLMPPRAAELR